MNNYTDLKEAEGSAAWECCELLLSPSLVSLIATRRDHHRLARRGNEGQKILYFWTLTSVSGLVYEPLAMYSSSLASASPASSTRAVP